MKLPLEIQSYPSELDRLHREKIRTSSHNNLIMIEVSIRSKKISN